MKLLLCPNHALLGFQIASFSLVKSLLVGFPPAVIVSGRTVRVFYTCFSKML